MRFFRREPYHGRHGFRGRIPSHKRVLALRTLHLLAEIRNRHSHFALARWTSDDIAHDYSAPLDRRMLSFIDTLQIGQNQEQLRHLPGVVASFHGGEYSEVEPPGFVVSSNLQESCREKHMPRRRTHSLVVLDRDPSPRR